VTVNDISNFAQNDLEVRKALEKEEELNLMSNCLIKYR
jgi:hypothetical protein